MARNISRRAKPSSAKVWNLKRRITILLNFWLSIGHIFMILIRLLFYFDVICFKVTRIYGKTTQTWRVSCAKDKQVGDLGNNYLYNSRYR
jgi:hypothetical protein